MTIEERTRPEIKLVSPTEDGERIYIARWIGDPITKEKKLGVFSSPKVKGSTVQDLDVKADVYQLTIFFDDEDHDQTSEDFWKSLDATGKWAIIHPTRGQLNLNFMRGVWENEPVRSVGFTTFNTNWIEGLPDGTEVSVSELRSTLGFFADQADVTAAEQLESNVFLDTFEQFNALVSAANKIVGQIKSGLKKFENLQLINPRLEALFRGISSTLESFPPDMEALSAQFTGLFDAISLSQNSSIGAVDNFIAFSQGLTGITNDDPTPENKNSVSMLEMNLALTNTALARAVLLGGIQTREQAVETATKLNDYFNSMITTLDETQVIFQSSPIELQYISQSFSYADQWKATQQAIKYLLSSALDLKVERVFTTKIQRATQEIAWTELGGPGEIIEVDGMRIDQNYSDFCDWNDLHGNDVMRLPADSVVRVFV